MVNLAAAKEAVRLTPVDAEAHLANAEVLNSAKLANESMVELERAVALRPADYSLWLSLGLLRDQMGDPTGALAAFDQSVRRAPFYAQPRWQRGNLLLRAGKYEAAFNDLNQAADSDADLIPSLVDLAWGISKGDLPLTEQLAQIKTERRRIAFAKLLTRQGKAIEALAQFRALGPVPADVRRELVERLLAKHAFTEAFEIWKGDQTIDAGMLIYDGGFEAPLSFDQGGFGWRVPRTLPGITLGQDSSKPHSGSKSLKVEFKGDSSPSSPPVAAQLVHVESARRYRISFAARSQEIVSGGLPIVVVNDAGGDRKLLAKSAVIGKGTTDWQVITFEFDVPSTTTAVLMAVQREDCVFAPCPAFGSLWLDSFSLQAVK